MGINMEDFYYEESNPKHVFTKCLIILFVIGLCIGIFLYYKEKNTITLKRVTIELGDKLSTNVNDYLLTGEDFSEEYKLDLSSVDVNVIGKYKYKVKYNKYVKEGTIVIQDTTDPIVETTNIEMNIKEELEPRLLVSNCEDLSLPCSVTFVDEKIVEKLKIAGTYDVEIEVSDAAGNKVLATTKVTSNETATLTTLMSNDLEYYTNNLNDDTIEHILFEKFDRALDDDSHEFTRIIQETSALEFSEYTEGDIYSAKLVTAYNKYGYAIGLQVIVTHYDGTIEYLTKGDS